LKRPTTQNRSTAVMERRFEPEASLDYFPTQPWAVRALCQFLESELGEVLDRQTCWEPACGEGFMAKPLAEYFASVRSSDVIAYPNFEHEILDFVGFDLGDEKPADWVIPNPPFKVADQFVARALKMARRGVVMFVRAGFCETPERYEAMFEGSVAPSYVVSYSERVVCLRGRLIQTGKPDPFNFDDTPSASTAFQPKRASSATGYNLVIWQHGSHDTRHRWIARCRVALERASDYPAYAEQWAELEKLQRQFGGQGKLL